MNVAGHSRTVIITENNIEIAYLFVQCPHVLGMSLGYIDHAVVLQIQNTCASGFVPKYDPKKQRYAANTMMRFPIPSRVDQPCGARPSRGTRIAANRLL